MSDQPRSNKDSDNDDDIKSNDQERILYLTEHIDIISVKPIIQKIIEINGQDDEEEKKLKDFKRKPITLFIDSSGGQVYPGIALISVIENSKTPIITRCDGWAMSCAFMIFICGHERICSKYATFMFHDISLWIGGKLEELKENVEQNKKLLDLLVKIVLDKTSIMKEQLDLVLERKSDWFFSADEAKKYKICDKFIGE